MIKTSHQMKSVYGWLTIIFIILFAVILSPVASNANTSPSKPLKPIQDNSKVDIANFHIDLGSRLGKINITKRGGKEYVILKKTNGKKVYLTANQYLRLIKQKQLKRSSNNLFLVFNITTWFGVIWVVLGLLGQVLFSGRMIVQWLVSEKAKRSIVPSAFWWMSLGGASMLVIYFIWRKDIVGFIGQSTGWAIYARNIWLIYRPDARKGNQ